MLQINELRVIPEEKKLVIDVFIPVTENIKIKAIAIDNHLTYVDGGPSSTPLYINENVGLVSSYRVELTDVDFQGDVVNIEKDMFFVYITTRDNSANEEVITKVVYNTEIIATMGLIYLQELSKDCRVPKGFVDFILRQKALELAIETSNHWKAIEYWDYFRNPTRVKTCNVNSCVSL